MISDETRNKWQDKIQYLIEERCDQLTDRESEFVDSIDSWLDIGKDLTHRQSKVLNKIFEKYQ